MKEDATIAYKYYQIEIYIWNKDLWITDGGVYFSKGEAVQLKSMIERSSPSLFCSIIEKEFDTVDQGFAALWARVDNAAGSGGPVIPRGVKDEAEGAISWMPIILSKPFQYDMLKHDMLKLYNPQSIYDIGIKMLDKPTENIILCQMTSTPILGASNVNSSEGLFYSKLLTRIKSGNNVIHGFAVDKTCMDMRTEHYDLHSAKNNLLQVYDDYGNNNYFRFFEMDADENSTSYLITDSEALWIHMIGGNRYYLYNASIPGSDIRQTISDLYSCAKMSFEDILCLYPDAV